MPLGMSSCIIRPRPLPSIGSMVYGGTERLILGGIVCW